MKQELKEILNDFNKDKAKEKIAFKAISKIKKKSIDRIFHDAHESVFKKINCLDCANCCKTTSPFFRETDIKRLSKHLKVKTVQFIDEYLKIDSDNDYVLKTSPCSFLNEDNTCQVYEVRPLACKGYPHTDRKNMHQLIILTKRNTEVCPAVCEIVNRITS